MDAAFGVFFMFTWRYCFILLQLYDKLADVPSRFVATCKGIILMMFPAILYYKAFHPACVTPRSVGLTTLFLLLYEVNRSVYQLHLLDRLASRNPRRVVIIGSGRRASKAWRAVRTQYRLSLRLLGFVDNREKQEMSPDIAQRYMGTLDDLDRIILNEVVDLILIAMPIQSCYPLMQRAVHIAESSGVQVLYLDDIYSTRRVSQNAQGDLFRQLVEDQDHYLFFLAVKRLVDIVGSLIGLIILFPLLLAIAIAVKCTSRGPILFRQERYGYRRRRFKMLKFRSMIHNAEHLLSDLEHANEAAGPIFKMRNDPRITPLGKRLRRLSLDELPQLWNVLVGDMSLVGPRPMSVRDVSLFDDASLMRRFSVRPGITGLWQVSGRSNTGFDHWIAMDNHYIDKRSLAADARILAQTIGAVIKGHGAM
jgi:exopolysaccharide biosynthesis polyprenyl glycosylphosphotransferase